MPEHKETEAYLALQDGDFERFNRLAAEGKADLRDAELKGFDLRGANLTGLDLTGAYLAYADLRGLDLRGCRLEGASLKGAKASGVYFPDEVPAEEIHLSIDLGTRIRERRAA
jgi:uncharacterized protein YjbI with pentapeptide repeats